MINSKLNGYATTTLYILEQFAANPNVNTVFFGTADINELNKSDIFPIVHVSQGVAKVSGQAIEIEYDIAVLDVRKDPNTFQSSKIIGGNLIFSLNTCLAILSKEIKKLELARNPHFIRFVNATPNEPIIFSDITLLDGWETKLTVSIQNEVDTRG